MSFTSDNPLQVNQLPVSMEFPPSYEEFLPIMSLLYKRIVAAMNSKEGSLYTIIEQGNFQRYYTPSDPQTFRNVYRLVVQVTPLVAGPNPFPHGIPSIAGFTFTHIYGVIQNATPTLVAAIPQGQPTGTLKGVSVEVNATDVVVTITAASPYIGFTGNVVLEYTKN